tara:strand:+ start:501 stop:683 length:183 start_codon:yes stop_codon:yes gene_type:complete
MVRLSLLLFLLASCSSTVGQIGYHVDDKPYKGTNWQNKEYVKPYWQCVDNNININCNAFE